MSPAKSAQWDYGYIRNDGKAFISSREGLVGLVESGIAASYVWTPETPEPVAPETLPFLIDAFRNALRKDGRNAILLGLALILLSVVLTLALQQWNLLYRSLFFVFGGVLLIEGIWRYMRSRHYTPEDAISDASTRRFAAWLEKQNRSGYTVTLVGCILLVAVVQAFVPESIELAGLVKPAVRKGEVWQLFTATLMHGNFMHLWFNLGALLFLSKLVEHTVQRVALPLVFLLSAGLGSVLSVLLYPNVTSVGASGGLMGLLGFVTIASYFDSTRYPPKYFRHLIEAIISVGVLGLFGFAFIDNAGRLGGLVGGLLLGWLLLRNNTLGIKGKEKLFAIAGPTALAALCVVTAFTVYRIVR